MTPLQVLARLQRSTTTTGTPEFIEAYRKAELERDPLAFHTPQQRRLVLLEQAVRDSTEGLKAAYAGVAPASQHFAASMRRGIAALMSDYVEPTQDDHRYAGETWVPGQPVAFTEHDPDGSGR